MHGAGATARQATSTCGSMPLAVPASRLVLCSNEAGEAMLFLDPHGHSPLLRVHGIEPKHVGGHRAVVLLTTVELRSIGQSPLARPAVERRFRGWSSMVCRCPRFAPWAMHQLHDRAHTIKRQTR